MPLRPKIFEKNRVIIQPPIRGMHLYLPPYHQALSLHLHTHLALPGTSLKIHKMAPWERPPPWFGVWVPWSPCWIVDFSYPCPNSKGKFCSFESSNTAMPDPGPRLLANEKGRGSNTRADSPTEHETRDPRANPPSYLAVPLRGLRQPIPSHKCYGTHKEMFQLNSADSVCPNQDHKRDFTHCHLPL